MKEIIEKLFMERDESYKEFMCNLMPETDRNSVIGVRIPMLRRIAKSIVHDGFAESFLKELPHQYYEENQLHSFITDYGNFSFEKTIKITEEFLPYIDNWAVCDSFKPAALAKEKEKLLPYIRKWLKSSHPFTVRYGFVLLLNWYLDKDFNEEILYEAAEIRSEKYYVNMGAAWFFSMALAKQYDSTIKLIEERVLAPEIHKMTISKAIDSRQINTERKRYLRSLK